MPTHDATLQVARDASPEVIRAAYRQLAQKWHPDKNPSRPDEAARKIREVNTAYDVLSDPERRREYDASLDAGEERTENPEMDRHVYMAVAVAKNRVKWLSLIFLLIAIAVIGSQAEAGNLPYTWAVGLSGLAISIKSWLEQRLGTTIAGNLGASRPLDMQSLYDRMLSVRVLHLLGRTAVWIVVVLAFWNGIFKPWLEESTAPNVAADAQRAAPPPAVADAQPRGGSVAPATDGYRLRFTNSCARAVRVAFRSRQRGEWSTDAWWSFEPSQSSLLTNASGQFLTLDDERVMMYAESTDGKFRWTGDAAASNDPVFIVDGRSLTFTAAQLTKSPGELHAGVRCDPTTSSSVR
jgi:hypothetical protein